MSFGAGYSLTFGHKSSGGHSQTAGHRSPGGHSPTAGHRSLTAGHKSLGFVHSLTAGHKSFGADHSLTFVHKSLFHLWMTLSAAPGCHRTAGCRSSDSDFHNWIHHHIPGNLVHNLETEEENF